MATHRIGKRARRMLVLVGLLVSSCGGRPDGPPLSEESAAPRSAPARPADTALGEKLPNPLRPARGLILISLDTLRADHLGCYGYPRPTSPNLDAFAATATRFSRSHSTAPWTLPSHASMFTGLYPFEHGARTCPIDQVSVKDRSNNAFPLDHRFVTVAEHLRSQRFQTAAFLANESYLGQKYQLDQGFGVYDVQLRTAEEVLRAATPWLRNTSKDRPFFLFLNLMDTHRPYNCRPRDGFPDHGGPREAGLLVQQLQSTVLGRKGEVPPELLQKLVDMYDTAIANLDEELGKFFARLRRLDLWDEVAIVITSDHGEYLGEHDLIEHSKDVYEGALFVPLLVKAPGQTQGAVDETPISSVHVPGLLLQHVRQGRALDGSDALVRHWPPHEIILAENHASRLHDLTQEWGARFQRVRKVIYEGDWKYIDSSDGACELYDLSRDPGELTNLLQGEGAERGLRARETLVRLRSSEVETGALPEELEKISPAERARLQKLGYLPGGPVSAEDG